MTPKIAVTALIVAIPSVALIVYFAGNSLWPLIGAGLAVCAIWDALAEGEARFGRYKMRIFKRRESPIAYWFLIALYVAFFVACLIASFGRKPTGRITNNRPSELKKPNKAPEPTPLPVMPRAEPRVTPGSGVAHL